MGNSFLCLPCFSLSTNTARDIKVTSYHFQHPLSTTREVKYLYHVKNTAIMWGVSYWVFPVISGFCWLGMLMGLLIHWTSTGKPRYASMDPTQSIAYISDVGAQSLKPLFIAGSCVTTIFLDLSFLSERWLRHRGRLAKNQTLTEKVLSWLSMFFALIGTCGLILLSIFDTLRHPTLHDIFALVYCWICHQRHLLVLGVPETWDKIPRAPHPPLLLLDQTHLYPPQSRSRHRLRRLQLQRHVQRSRRIRMDHRIYLHLLGLLVLHRPSTCCAY